MISKNIYKILISYLIVLFIIVGCGDSIGNGFSSLETNSSNFIDSNSITEEHLIQAKQIDDLLKLDNNRSSDELFLDLQGIMGSNVLRYEDTFEIKFGEMEVLIDNNEVNKSIIKNNKPFFNKNTNKIVDYGIKNCTSLNSKKMLFLYADFSKYLNSNDFEVDVYNKVVNLGYCIDIYYNNGVTDTQILKTDEYDFVSLVAHSNEKGVFVLGEEESCTEVTECTEKVKNGKVSLYKNAGLVFVLRNEEVRRYITPDFFSTSSLDYRIKETTLFIGGCETLKRNPSPLTKHITKSGAYGAIGFKTLSLPNLWSPSLNKELFKELLKKNVNINTAVLEARKNVDTIRTDIGDWIKDTDIQSLHLQTDKDYEIYLNPELESPKNVKVTDFKRSSSNDNLTISWDAVGKATDYKVRVTYTIKDTDISRYTETDWVDETNTIVSIKKPELADEYIVKVKARDKYSLSAVLNKEENPVSNFTNIIYSVKGLAYPQNLKVKFIEKTKDGDKIRFSWDKVDGAIEYQVLWQPVDGIKFAREWVSSNYDEFILNKEGKRYFLDVRAKNREGVLSEFSLELMVYSPSKEEVIPEVVITKLEAPKLNNSVNISNEKATLTWNKVENATSYKVYVSDNKGVSSTNNIASYPSVKTTITIPNIKKGKKYYVVVEAKNIPKKLLSSLSNEIEVYEKEEAVTTPTNTTTPVDVSTLTLQDCKDKTLNQEFSTNTWTTSLDEWNRVHIACVKIFSDNESENTPTIDTPTNSSRTSVEYMGSHKNERLASTDCKSNDFNGWKESKNKLISTLAPADNMMKSIEGCIDVIKLTELGGLSFSKAVESVVRSRTKKTSPFSDIWDKSATETPTLTVDDVTDAQNNADNSSATNSGTLTLEKCKNKYEHYTSFQWASSQSSGEYKGEAAACYHALVTAPSTGIDAQLYIDQYNNGVYGK